MYTFYSFVTSGMAFASGNPESMADMVSSDPEQVTVMRFCFVNATGLVSYLILSIMEIFFSLTGIWLKMQALFSRTS